jgi:hypothetical protein
LTRFVGAAQWGNLLRGFCLCQPLGSGDPLEKIMADYAFIVYRTDTADLHILAAFDNAPEAMQFAQSLADRNVDWFGVGNM